MMFGESADDVRWGSRVKGQRLVSVNMVCSFLTVLKPLMESTNSSPSNWQTHDRWWRSCFRRKSRSEMFSPGRCPGVWSAAPMIPHLSCRWAGWRCAVKGFVCTDRRRSLNRPHRQQNDRPPSLYSQSPPEPHERLQQDFNLGQNSSNTALHV